MPDVPAQPRIGDDPNDYEHGYWKPKPRTHNGGIRVLRVLQIDGDYEFYDPDGGHEDRSKSEDGVWLPSDAQARAAMQRLIEREISVEDDPVVASYLILALIYGPEAT